jgi:hypothetical protein
MCDPEINEIYEFYWEIKTLIAVYEVNHNECTADLLNEIRNAFDHIARCYKKYGLGTQSPNDDMIRKNLTKAKNHLERLHLDLYKNMLLQLRDKMIDWVKILECQSKVLVDRPYPMTDVVKFHSEFHEKRIAVENVLTQAKQQEFLLERHDEKILELKKAKREIDQFNTWVNQQYYNLLPYLEEAVQITKKDRKRYCWSTYIIPVILFIAGILIGKFF